MGAQVFHHFLPAYGKIVQALDRAPIVEVNSLEAFAGGRLPVGQDLLRSFLDFLQSEFIGVRAGLVAQFVAGLVVRPRGKEKSL